MQFAFWLSGKRKFVSNNYDIKKAQTKRYLRHEIIIRNLPKKIFNVIIYFHISYGLT